MDKFVDFIDYLKRETISDFYIELSEIERIIGQPLSMSAYKHSAYWSNDGIHRFAVLIGEVGFRIKPDLKNKRIRLIKGDPIVKEKVSTMSEHRERKRSTKPFSGEDGHVILLNKPFLGGWLDNEGHIGHEIIDFLLTDDNQYFVYNNPWGACPDDIWIEGTTKFGRSSKERYVGKYMILTSESRNKDFDILYVIELKEKLHRCHTSKDDDAEEYKENQKEIIKLMRELNIKYNDKYLDEIYGFESLYVTFRGSKIYKAETPITITGLDYNFQRNKGYIYDSKFPDDYRNVLSVIESSIESGQLVEFVPRKVNHETIGELNASKTFLDLIDMQDSEQVYTNILHSLLSESDLLKKFCERYKEDKLFDLHGTFKVFRETKVVDGRMDVCGESANQRVIIENKVYSGLNGLKPADNKTQLSTYYEWGKEKDMEPLCFVVAPNFRIGDIKNEITKLDPLMEPIYLIKTYGDVAAFIEEEYNAGNIPPTYIYYFLIPQIINAFRNFSYSTKEDLYARKFLEATN